ncbi:MAG: preprotein translocase subunit SecG [Candidatus Omnitrophota bacterium]
MYSFVLAVHIIVVVILICIILVQRGRSSGLIEAFGGVESIFGTKTNSFFVKVTVVLSVLFFLTSISLAYLSKEKSKSLFERVNLSDEASSDNQAVEETATQKDSPQVPKETQNPPESSGVNGKKRQ